MANFPTAVNAAHWDQQNGETEVPSMRHGSDNVAKLGGEVETYMEVRSDCIWYDLPN